MKNLSTFYLFRIAIERDSVALKSAMLTLVYFYIVIIVQNCQQAAKIKLLLNKNSLLEVFPLTIGSGKTIAFENRWSRYKELGKKVPQAYRVYVEDTFLPCDAGDARIFVNVELDEETGLYYYGTRYLDPRYSRWLSGDPALNDYIPKAGADTSKLPNGGAYNCFNFAVFGYGNNNPIKYNDPTGETASYSIDDENKTITINVEIIIFGKDATSEIAQIYEKGIMDAWGGEWTANYNGEEYKVSINANVKLGKRPNIFQKIWNFFFGTKNYVNVENRERAYVVFGFYGNWRAVGRGTRTLSQDNPAGHEFGHLLGFDDRYDYNTQNPKPGWEGNIIAEATYKPSIVEQRDINRMVDYISNQKIFGYRRKHGNIRPWRMLY